MGYQDNIEYPMGMGTDAMFPEVSAVFTDPVTGTSHDVACYIPGVEAEIEDVVCPFPFVRPNDKGNPRPCIQPCPVSAYSEDEYTLMWTLATIVAM